MEGNVADKLKENDPNTVTGQSFFDMSFVEKLTFLGKVCVFLISAGFAFPNIFSE
jgi:hypothetical protein